MREIFTGSSIKMSFALLEFLDKMTFDEEEKSEGTLGVLFRGKSFLENGKFEEALEIYRKFYADSKKLYEEDKNEYDFYVLGIAGLAEVQRNSGKYQEALKTYDELLRMSIEIKDVELEVYTHGMLFEMYEEYGKFYSESLAHLIQMYEIVKTNSLKLPGYMASLVYNITERYRLLNDFTKALEYANETLSYGLKAGSESGYVVAAAYTSMGRVHLRCGDLAKAEESFEAAFTVASEDEKARPAIMDSYLGLAQLAARRNQTEKLEELVEKAENEASKVPASEERENVKLKLLCKIYKELAVLKIQTGNFRHADDILQKCLDLARKSGDQREQCDCLQQSIMAYISCGEVSKALRCCYEIQEITSPPRYRHLQYMTYSNLLAVNQYLGNFNEALENCQKWWKSLEIYHSDDRVMKAGLLSMFSVVYFDFGKDSQTTENLLKAIRYLEEDAEMAEQLEISTLCETLDALAVAYYKKGELHKALKLAQKASSLKNNSKDKPAKAENLKILGCINIALERFEEAEQNLKEALQLSLECEDQKLIADSYGLLGLIAIKKNDFQTAISCLNQSTAIRDKLRKRISQQAHKISYMEISTEEYYILELLYCQCKRYDDALVTSERRRARAFIDMIHAKYWSRGHLQVSQNLTEPSFEKLRMIVDNEKAIFVVFSDHLKIQEEIFIRWIMVPEKGVIAVDVVKMKEFAPLIRDLRRMICPGDPVPVRKSRNTQERNIFKDDILDDTDSGSPDVDDLLKQIYQKLFGDNLVTSEEKAGLSGCKNLVIVPSGAMFLLPFAALIMPDGKRMDEKFNLRITASIQALELKENEKESKKKIDTLNVLSVGNPNVPTVKLYGVEKTPLNLDNAEVEAKEVARLFKSQPLIYNEATKEAVLSRLPSADLVHFACHGSWRYKALLLAPSDKKLSNEYTEEHVLLTAGEILELDLKAKLVVLSACNSGTGELNSEGVVGLTRSFLGAGALAVIAALWLLPDEATQVFMEKFYISWKSGKLASESLREATEVFRSNHEFNHPFFWAPFVLMGHDVRLEL